MATGFPDFQSQQGRGVSGDSIDSTSFTGSIAAGATGNFNLAAVPTGEEHFYQGFVLGVSDDAFIHNVKLIRVSDTFIWWYQDFVTSGSWEVPGFKFSAGQQLRISITNNGDSALTFSGAIFTTKRKI